MRRVGVVALLSLILSGCQPAAKNEALSPITEAYALMDEGENARAIILLETTFKQNPKNDEVRVALASAYLGVSGVDIYSFYDSFQDLIFSKPLKDTIWSKLEGEKKDLGDRQTRPSVVPDTSESGSSQLQEWLDQADEFLTRIRASISFLNRFPDLETKNWLLLDRALELLDGVQIRSSKDHDVILYRLIVRVIYFRSYIYTKWIKSSDFGTRKWSCQLGCIRFRDQLVWLDRLLEPALEDVIRLYPDQRTSIETIGRSLSGLLNESPGSDLSFLQLQVKAQEFFQCAP